MRTNVPRLFLLVGGLAAGYLLASVVHLGNRDASGEVDQINRPALNRVGNRRELPIATGDDVKRKMEAWKRRGNPKSSRSDAHSEDSMLDDLIRDHPSQLLSADQSISDEICEYLAITQEERTGLNGVIQQTLRKLQLQQIKNIRTVQVGNDGTEFIIAPFQSIGRVERQELCASIEKTLGSERAVLLAKLTNGLVDDSFLGFGASECRISIRPMEGGDGTKWSTHVMVDGRSRLFETPDIPEFLKGVVEAD